MHRYHDRHRNAPTMEHRKKDTTFAATIVDPTGVPARIDTNIPISAQTTDSTTEQTVTERKLLNSRIADIAGKITSAEIISEPTNFIAMTMTTAIMTANNRL